MDGKLSGIPETMLIPLWARAVEGRNPHPIIRDEKALRMVEAIDYDFTKFANAWKTQVGVCVRTMLLDNAVRAFFGRYTEPVVVNLGAGLDTRYERLGSENVLWYDIDLPEGIAMRRRFFEESENCRFIEGSAFDLSWVDRIEHKGRPVLVIVEGLLMYFEEADVRGLLTGLADRLPGGEMLLEIVAPFMVGRSRIHDSVNSVDRKLEFLWSIFDDRELEQWHPRMEFIESWNYFDYFRDRWKVFGMIARLPCIRPRFASRIAHIRFADRRTRNEAEGRAA